MTKDKEELYKELKSFLDSLPKDRKEEFLSVIKDMVEDEKESNEGKTNILRFPNRKD